MRERLLELLPLLLVGVVLLVYQLSHLGTPVLQFLPLPLQAASPTLARSPAAAALPTATPARPTPPPVASPLAGSCSPSTARFVGGMLTLKAALGANMGDPVECEHAINDAGDTQQKTTTGLSYYESKLNLACFTTGWDHWAWTEQGLVYWTGEAVDPPNDAALVTR